MGEGGGRKRGHVSLTTKLAAALLWLGDIPYTHAKLMTAEQFISLYHFDHGMRHSDDGSDEFWNLTPRLIQAHRRKTATVDAPALAKSRRIRDSLAVFNARLAAKAEGVDPLSSPPRAKIQSRGFDKRFRKKMSGKVEPR